MGLSAKFNTTVLLFPTILLLNSCATILRGRDGNPKKRTSLIAGVPDSATVFLDGEKIGVTPLTYTFSRLNKETELIIKKDGFITGYYEVDKQLNIGAAAISFIGILWVYPIIVDFANGSVYDAPKEIKYTLKPKK